MKVNGLMMHTTAKELNNGTTTKSSTRETLPMDLKQAKVNLNSMEIFTKAILLMDSSMAKENTTLMKRVKSMKEISMKIKFMEVD
jgi:hypothetical protein